MDPEKLIEHFSNIIKNEFKPPFTGGTIELQDGLCKPIKLNKKGKVLCIQTDKKVKGWNNNFPFFNESVKNLCSISDYILFYPVDKQLFVFIIELKSKNTDGSPDQLKAGFELSKYICRTAFRLINYPNIKTEYRCLVFSHKVFKGTSKPKSIFDKELNSEIKYAHLQSGSTYSLDTLTKM